MIVAVNLPPRPEAIAKLQTLGATVDCLGNGAAAPAMTEALGKADVYFGSHLPAGHESWRALRWVQLGSVGYEQLAGHRLAERGIRATNARGVTDPQIGEWNLAMMINLVRDVPAMVRNQAAGKWDKSPFQGEIRGRTVGFWGYGGLARETARLARQFGMTVHVLTRRGISRRDDIFAVDGTGDPDGTLPHRSFIAGQEEAFLADLDFLVLALPLTRSSEGVVGEKELRALPRRAFLLNPARGKLVREDALLRALGEGWIAGAALDTHHHYPLPPDHPLWRNPRVIVTPHQAGGGFTPAVVDRLWELFVRNAERYRAGLTLLNELSPAELADA